MQVLGQADSGLKHCRRHGCEVHWWVFRVKNNTVDVESTIVKVTGMTVEVTGQDLGSCDLGLKLQDKQALGSCCLGSITGMKKQERGYRFSRI